MPKKYHLSSRAADEALLWDRSHREIMARGQKPLGQWSFIGIIASNEERHPAIGHDKAERSRVVWSGIGD
ncbi:MAG: hypothetical protein BGO83_14545 [Devosia sp. 66-14]|nr:MAG: hypothetical protein BGO83_14545 [Devosia sp. 66-14]